MTTLIAGGVVAIICVAAIWLAVWQARRAGAAQQQAADAVQAKQAESTIAQAGNEQRDTADTEKRMDEGTF